MFSKGKTVASGKGKGKWTGDEDKSGGGGGRKRRNREVLQFFEDAAEEDDYDSGEDSDLNFDFDDFMDEDVKEPAKAQNVSFLPKEEEMDEEEFDKMMEDRYKSNPRLQACRDDVYDDISMPSGKTPTIWKVKCTVGRERHSVFCLMQKFVDLKSLGNKLQIISAFVVDHAKGFVYIEAEKQVDINEACKGISTIYSSRLAPIPKNEVSHLLAIRNNKNPISEGMWARVKNGRYKGDLAQIVFVNDERRKATVMLIPRIDLQVLAQKIGGGVAPKNAVIPAPKLITSTELDEFRPLMTCRRDRDTSKMFEVLDGNMLKDGFLYKKVPIDSLSCHGIVPLEEELLKFRPSESNKSDNLEWLKELYGAPKKKRGLGNDKGGEKGGGSSASGTLDGFELYELVCYGRKDFGLVVGMEKEGDYYKILKQGPEGPIVDSAPKHSLKHGPSDVKFNALDHKSKRISVDDTVRVFEGPLKDKEGIAKQIYKGIIFIYDENETENGGYFCSKAQMCEKVELSSFAFSEKGGESGPSGFEDFPSSPKSPLSPPKPWQTKEKDRNFSQGDKDGMFAVGQTLRIKVGPLKGYLCQVLGIRYSDITVKLGSQQKILTVKSEHLSEVRGRSSAVPTSDDPGSSSFKPFDVLGTEGGSGGWGDEAKTSNDGDGWNTGDVSSERTSWAGFATGSNNANPSSSLDNDAKKEDAWDTKVSPNLISSWGAAAADDNVASDSNQAQGWGKKEDSWNKAVGETGSKAVESVGWGKTDLPSENPAGGVKTSADNWGQANPQEGGSSDAGGGWGTAKSMNNPTSSWGAGNTGQSQPSSWGNGEGVTEGGSGEKNMSSSAGGGWNNKDTGFNHEKSEEKTDTWGKAAEVQDKCAVRGDSWGKAAGGSSSHAVEGWGNAGAKTQPEAGSADAANAWKQDTSDGANQTSNWGSGGGSASQKQTGGWNKPQTEPSVGKQDSSWIIHEGGASWNKQQGESSWGKQDGGSSWSNKQDGEQQSGGWNSASDGGRGSGGRRGRGGRWGGRDQSAGGRSFGQGQSSGWEGEKKGDGGNSSNPSSWSKNSGAGWGKSKPEVESSSPSFRSWMGADTGTGGSENKDLSSKGVSTGKNEGASWNASSADQPSSWCTKAGAVDTKTDQGTGKGWGESAADAKKDSVWNSEPSNAGGNAESSWGKKKEWNSGGAGKEWGKGAGDANKGSDWNSEPSIAGGNAEPSWGKKKEWDSGGAGKDWGKGTGDANKGSGWNSEPSNAGGSQWGKKGDWNSGSSENQNSGWGNKSSWSSQQENANQYSQGDGDGTRGGWRGGSGGSGGFRGRGDRGGFRGRSDRGGFEGRGDRGGFGGRGDRGGFGGRSRSDEGGFRGRGRSDRGGFGGRGRGRRDFNGGNDNNGGSSWSSGGDGTNNQGGGWSSQNSGWSHSTATKDSGNDNAAGGWSKGQGSNSQGGGWGSKPSGSGDADATGNQTKSWNQSGAAGGGWGSNSKEAGGGGASGSGWGSSKEAGAGGTSGSGWGNSKEAGGGGASGSGWGNSKEAGGGGASGSGWGNSKEAGGGGTSGSGWGN